MAWGIVCQGVVGHATVREGDPINQWMETADVEAHWGRGFATFSFDPARALRFDTAQQAFEFWNQTSRTMPVRPWDGKPNRPLTIFTVEVRELPI